MRSRTLDAAWGLFAVANLFAMVVFPTLETIPFHLVWISLTILYGFRVWPLLPTLVLLCVIDVLFTVLIALDVTWGTQVAGELFEVPLMSAMFLAMVWHARRRQAAMLEVETLAESRASLLERQECFLHDASHELRTPVTIARGHLELVQRGGGREHDLEVALDELARMERIVERLLLLAKADQPDFVVPEPLALEVFLEDVFVRWADVAPRVWRLGATPAGLLLADPAGLRAALDALLENAVKFSDPRSSIELRAVAFADRTVAIEVEDEGIGIPDAAFGRIFERFGRADAARSRAQGGVGLGLAIVDAIAKAHGGRCSVRAKENGSVFSLRLPGFDYAGTVALSAVRSEPTYARNASAPSSAT